MESQVDDMRTKMNEWACAVEQQEELSLDMAKHWHLWDDETSVETHWHAAAPDGSSGKQEFHPLGPGALAGTQARKLGGGKVS